VTTKSIVTMYVYDQGLTSNIESLPAAHRTGYNGIGPKANS
jgi:hypothetical protein